MRHLKACVCEKCGKTYYKWSGGVVANPTDNLPGLCPDCKKEKYSGIWGKLKI